MLAGYHPDPITKPEPGNQIAYLASFTRDQPLVLYVEYIYSGQVAPADFLATYNYVRAVNQEVARNPRVRRYQRDTINRILEASLAGRPQLNPHNIWWAGRGGGWPAAAGSSDSNRGNARRNKARETSTSARANLNGLAVMPGRWPTSQPIVKRVNLL